MKVVLYNVSVKFGNKFRHNQNFRIYYWTYHTINNNSTDAEIIQAIKNEWSNKVRLKHNSQIKIIR